MKHLFKIVMIIVTLVSCDSKENKSESIAAPLVDGKYNDYIALNIQPLKIHDLVDLYIYQNDHYVWLCFTLPEGSYGILDMHIQTPAVKDSLNLHVSGQIGEWYLNDPSTIPENPESDKWWNMDGWNANFVWPNGMDRLENDFRYRFKLSEARELQLSKDRFGRGEWQLKMKIGSIRKPDGSFTSFYFPDDKSFYSLNVD